MARLRTREAPGSKDLVLPEELKDFRDRVWLSADLTAKWYRDHGLTMAPGDLGPWQMRRGRAEWAWAVHNGVVVSGTEFPRPDHHRMRALGASRINNSLERAARIAT